MKLGCVIGLLLYAAFVYGYYLWLGQTFEGKELWIASFIVGLIATLGVGALGNSYYAWRDGAVLSDALIDMPRRDGKRTAVAGTLEPLGQMLTAPLSGKPCVLYEYDVFRQVTRTKNDGGTETSKSVDFAGVGKTECIIRSTSSKLRLIGFPDLEPLDEDQLVEKADVLRARQYVQFTAWEDVSGLGVLRGVRDMFSALTGNEESFRKDWRMISVRDCAWLKAEPAANPAAGPDATAETNPRIPGEVSSESAAEEEAWDDEDEDIEEEQRLDEAGADADHDEDDDDGGPPTWRDGSGYHPQLSEKRLEPGQQVVAIGHYDEVRQGLVGGGAHLIKIYLDDLQTVARKLAATKWSYLVGGILTLAIVNVGVWGAQQIYRRSDATERKWREQLEKAIRDDDVQTIDRLQKRGADLKALLRSGNQPPLLTVRDPAMARLLIERGADVNATDGSGTTALMQAVRNKNPEMVKLLIQAKANLDAKNTNYHTTALMDAEGRCEECAELLRKAGAKDDRATAENGEPIDESHETFGVCRDYLAAVFAADPAKLRELSTPELGEHFDGVDFPTWQESRPTKPRLASGFVRGDDATLTIVGPNPAGFDRTWVYQLRRSAGKWLVSRERWVTGLP